MGCNRNKTKKLSVIILGIIAVIAILTPPISMAATEDTIHVTFNPEGAIDLGVSPNTLNFSTVSAETSEESSTTFTLYNNGSIAMKTYCESNTTTDEGDLTLDDDGSPAEDYFSLQFTTASNLDGNTEYIPYLPSQVTLDNSLSAEDSETFKITIHLGAISTNHSWQTTTVNFTGTAA